MNESHRAFLHHIWRNKTKKKNSPLPQSPSGPSTDLYVLWYYYEKRKEKRRGKKKAERRNMSRVKKYWNKVIKAPIPFSYVPSPPPRCHKKPPRYHIHFVLIMCCVSINPYPKTGSLHTGFFFLFFFVTKLVSPGGCSKYPEIFQTMGGCLSKWCLKNSFEQKKGHFFSG